MNAAAPRELAYLRAYGDRQEAPHARQDAEDALVKYARPGTTAQWVEQEFDGIYYVGWRIPSDCARDA
jgi:hypothetical protein